MNSHMSQAKCCLSRSQDYKVILLLLLFNFKL